MTKIGENKMLWARLLGGFLILAGILCTSEALGWLWANDQTIASPVAVLMILVVQIAMVIVGSIFILWPQLLNAFIGFKTVLLGSVATLVLIGLVGTLGLLLAPKIDYLLATTPEFNCSEADYFCNQTAAAGLKDVKRYGKGAAFVDFNGDGWVDLFVADAERRLREDDWGISSFYLNSGDGTFRSIDLGINTDDLLSSWNASFSDMDNDGDPDLALASGGYAGYANFSIYENRMQEAGKFVSVTGAAGFSALNDKAYRWWGLSWADYDNDGLLDLAISRAYGPVKLFHNEGNNKFSDVTRSMGITTPRPWYRDGKNIVWFDFDNDGDQDIYFAGIEAHMFFENIEGKSFRDITEKVFANVFPENKFYSNEFPVVFSAAAADFDQDGDEDLYLGRQMEQDLVLFNDGAGIFSAEGIAAGIDVNLSRKGDRDIDFENTMGLGVGDIFDDGWPDIIVGSGDPKRADKDVIFCNKGGLFERCTEVLRGNADGPFRTRTHGVAFADVNQDGATDIFQSLGGDNWWDRKLGIDSREYGALFVRTPPFNLKTATLLLEGTKSNRDAIGARIRVVADETHYYTVRSTQAFQSQNSRQIIVALGQSDSAEVEIAWPSGVTTKLTVAAGERQAVKE
jgi:hypothetical protein